MAAHPLKVEAVLVVVRVFPDEENVEQDVRRHDAHWKKELCDEALDPNPNYGPFSYFVASLHFLQRLQDIFR